MYFWRLVKKLLMVFGYWKLKAQTSWGRGHNPCSSYGICARQRLPRKIGVIDASLGEGCFSKAIVLNSPADCTCGTFVHWQVFSFWDWTFFPPALSQNPHLDCSKSPPSPITFLGLCPGMNIHNLIPPSFFSSLFAFTIQESLATPKLHLPPPFQGG